MTIVFEKYRTVKEILKSRPHIKLGGPDGLNVLMKKQFGFGISAELFRDFKAEIEAESPTEPVIVPREPEPVPESAVPDQPTPYEFARRHGYTAAHVRRYVLSGKIKAVEAMKGQQKVWRILFPEEALRFLVAVNSQTNIPVMAKPYLRAVVAPQLVDGSLMWNLLLN